MGAYILCGTSRAHIYLGCNTENKRGYISCGSVQMERTSTWLFKENKGGYIPCGSLLVKDFTRLLEISRTGGCLGTRRRHGLWLNRYKSFVCFLLPYTLYFSAVYFLFPFYFCLSYCFCSLLSNNLVVKPN